MNIRMSGLTPRQADARRAIEAFFCKNGYAPSYAELGAALGVTGESAAKLIDCLERRGHLVRQRGVRRSLALVPMTAAA